MAYKPKVLDLFCGAGGLSLGFRQAGCKILGGIDVDKWPVITHHRNFPDAVVKLDHTDIAKVSPDSLGLSTGAVDILIGGPPCQGFSQVGSAKIRHLGLEDEKERKNRLYKQYIKFLDYFQPPYFVIENVNGMKGVNNINIFHDAIRELVNGPGRGYSSGIKYDVEHQILCARDYGVPQNRYRLFIIGRRSDLTDLEIYFPQPLGRKPVTLREAIGDLSRLSAPVLVTRGKGDLGNAGITQHDRPRKYRCSPENEYQHLMRVDMADAVMNHLCRGHNQLDLKIFGMLKQGQKYKDLPAYLRRYRDDIFDDKYRRLKYNEPSPTVTAHMQKDTLAFIHPTQTRSISAREAARIQSFPDSFVFQGPLTKVLRQIGNAVPPLLAEQVASGLVRELRRNLAKSASARSAELKTS